MVLLHEVLSRDIIGAAIQVLNELKPGLDEKLYERALVIELLARGHQVDAQRQYPVSYRGQLVGTLIPDLIVDDRIVLDTKVVSAFNDTHLAQMTGYLAITGVQLGLLLNFKYAMLQVKRVIREHAADAAAKTERQFLTADGADYADKAG